MFVPSMNGDALVNLTVIDKLTVFEATPGEWRVRVGSSGDQLLGGYATEAEAKAAAVVLVSNVNDGVWS